MLSNIWQDAEGIKVEQLSKKPPSIPASFIAARGAPASAAAQLSCLEVEKEEYHIVESLRIVEPRLQRLTTGLVAGIPVIYGDLGLERLLPLSIMGEGLQRLTYTGDREAGKCYSVSRRNRQWFPGLDNGKNLVCYR